MNNHDREIFLEYLKSLPEEDYKGLENKSDQELIDWVREKNEDSRKNGKLEIENLRNDLKEKERRLRRLTFWKMPIHFLQKSPLSLLAFIVAFSIVLFPQLSQLPNEIKAKLLGSVAMFGTGANSLQKTREEQEKLLTGWKQMQGEAEKNIESGKDALANFQREMLQSDLEIKKQVNEIEIQKIRIEKLQRKTALNIVDSSSSLNALIQELSRNELYEEKLGYLHQLQRKLADLTNCFYYNPDAIDFNEEQLRKLKKDFPRGPARIVLFVDDLDRCPPDRVVEVLEAIQLLVKTPLFIAVLAIDERYIIRALEKHYAGVLFHKGRPSGTDYLEKIIQIPYRIRPVSDSVIENYLNKQMDVEPTDLSKENPQEQEIKALLKCCQRIELSPRMIKRLVNIYKIFKISEQLANKVGKKSPKQTNAILSVLALSARYPDLMREVFDDLDIQFEELKDQLQEIKQEEKQQELQKLKLLDSLQNTLVFLVKIAEKNKEKDDPHLQREYSRLQHDATILLSEVTLAQFDLETFNLVRSFCFFGDIGYSPEDYEKTIHSDQG